MVSRSRGKLPKPCEAAGCPGTMTCFLGLFRGAPEQCRNPARIGLFPGKVRPRLSMAEQSKIRIGSRLVGPGEPSFIVAEVAQAHDGSLGTAHAYIDAAARTGVDAIKFQTHIAHAESSPEERFRVNTFPQDATRYAYWRRMEFSPEQWAGLASHARERGLVFLSTPFSFEAVDILERLDMPAWKIGSGDTANFPLIERVSATGRPVLLSSGMSPWSELDEAVARVRRHDAQLAVFQCTTAYPCPPEQTGLNVVAELRERYGVPVGLSDHSGTIYPAVAATTLGANLIEVHLVLSRECFGPDVTSSVTTAELASLVKGVRFVERSLRSPVSKDAVAADKARLRELFGRSLVLREELPAGHVLRTSDFAFRKPGTGIPARRLDEMVGRRLRRACAADAFLKEDDVE